MVFCRALDADPRLCAAVRAAATPDEIVALARAQGLEVTQIELRVFSRQLVSDCFPWASQDRTRRLRFFATPPKAEP